MLTRIRRHDAEWQPGPEHAASCQRRQDEAAACVLERIVQVGPLSYSKAVSRIPVQKNFYSNDGTGDSSLRVNTSASIISFCHSDIQQ